MPDFSRRSESIEVMDDLTASGEIIDVTLRELEVINKLLGGNYVTIQGVKELARNANKKIKLVDVGCGSGDILKLIRKELLKSRVDATLVGVDANPNIVAYARANTLAVEEISYKAMDIFSDEFRSQEFDILTGTLFFHHFTDEQLISFFRQLKDQLTIGFVINDIHRHWFAYHSIKWLTRLFSRSSMVIHDAPVSVLRAFKRPELENILHLAGVEKYRIRWMWAFRWQVIVDFRK